MGVVPSGAGTNLDHVSGNAWKQLRSHGCFPIFTLAVACLGVEIDKFRVPSYVDRKSPVSLECAFTLYGRETLQSVKWYRTERATGYMEEFYSYQPSKNPPAKSFARKGIVVDVSNIPKCSPKSMFQCPFPRCSR